MEQRGKVKIVCGQFQKGHIGSSPLPRLVAHILHLAKDRTGIHLCCRKIMFLNNSIYVNCLTVIEVTCVREVEGNLCWKMYIPRCCLLHYWTRWGIYKRLIFQSEATHSTFSMIMKVQQQSVVLFSSVSLAKQLSGALSGHSHLPWGTSEPGVQVPENPFGDLAHHKECTSQTRCDLSVPVALSYSVEEAESEWNFPTIFSTPLWVLGNCASTMQVLDFGLCGLLELSPGDYSAWAEILLPDEGPVTHGNIVSMATLVQVLHHLKELPCLMLEVSSASLESYSMPGNHHTRTFDLLCAEITNVFRDLGNLRPFILAPSLIVPLARLIPKTVSPHSYLCPSEVVRFK